MPFPPQGIDGWISNKVPLLRSECGTLGSILGGYNVAAGGNFLRKVYQHLPEHTGIHVMLDAIAIDSWVRCQEPRSGDAWLQQRCVQAPSPEATSPHTTSRPCRTPKGLSWKWTAPLSGR